jgi:hypothetical protein
MVISPLARSQQCDYNRKRHNEAEQNDLRNAGRIDDGDALRQIVTLDQHGSRAIPHESAPWGAHAKRLRLWREASVANHDRFCRGIFESNEV